MRCRKLLEILNECVFLMMITFEIGFKYDCIFLRRFFLSLKSEIENPTKRFVFLAFQKKSFMKYILFSLIILTSFSTIAQKNPFKTLTESNGKIGIGTKSPDELLTVKGTIHAQEVKVDLQGAVAPDYVFEHYFQGFSRYMPEYRLMTLSELDDFIRKNHHLPKISSASEMEKEGFNLKEMNLKLLEKIEELTIYTLQQQKEIDFLKSEIQHLKEN